MFLQLVLFGQLPWNLANNHKGGGRQVGLHIMPWVISGQCPPRGCHCTGWICVSTWHRLELSQRKELQLGKCLHEIQLWGIFSISDQVGRAPCGWCHLWAGSLSFIREKAEQARGSKPVKNIPPWLLHQLLLPDLPEFQSWLLSVMNSNGERVSWINPFLPNLPFGMMLVQE